jgi:hypothetical protein
MKIQYEPMPNQVPGVYTVWLIDGTPRLWLVGYNRSCDDGRWVSRRRDDGEPILGFPRRSDAAAFLAVAGRWFKRGRRRHRRIARAGAIGLLALVASA